MRCFKRELFEGMVVGWPGEVYWAWFVRIIIMYDFVMYTILYHIIKR